MNHIWLTTYIIKGFGILLHSILFFYLVQENTNQCKVWFIMKLEVISPVFVPDFLGSYLSC